MGIFGKILKLVITVVETPVAVVKDIATMGAELTDEKGTYTGRKLRELEDDVQDIKDECSK